MASRYLTPLTLNSSGSLGSRPASSSTKESSSITIAMRAAVGMRRWKLHLGQTWRFSSSSPSNRSWAQDSHLSHRPLGTDFFCSVRTPPLRDHQDICGHSYSPGALLRNHRD